MRKFRRIKTIAAIGLSGSAIAFTQPALADEHTVQIGGRVPITCTADLTGTITAMGPASYSLGNVSQFCNTAFSMTVSHPTVTSGASFQFRSISAAAGTSSTLISASLPPTNGSAPLYMTGVSETEANALSGNLMLSVVPLGV